MKELSEMIYRTNQNANLPSLGFGTWELKGDVCREAVRDALSIGYRHIDTARAYNNEADVGRGIAESGVHRDDVFLASKLWKDMLTPGKVRAETERSLLELKTDYLDLLMVHWPNPVVPIEETLGAMNDLATEGKIKHVGVSNFSIAQLEEANTFAAIFCDQVEYHPYIDRRELLAAARDSYVLIVAYSPLAQGRVFQDSELQKIGSRYGKDPGQVALRWLIQQQNVAALTRSTDSSHRQRSFDIFDFDLTPEEMALVDNFVVQAVG
jgi:2,5-diketo-D-gluconate reductase B